MKLKEGELWSWTRSVMSQAACIQQDYQSGHLGGYEAYSARLDAAASDRADELEARLLEARSDPAMPASEKPEALSPDKAE